MAIMSLDSILERVQELKQENEEKDEVIRVQQAQIDELEAKIKDLEARCDELAGAASQAEELVEKLSQVLS